MKPEAHGGDLLRMAATAGRDPASLLDFSVNVRPEGRRSSSVPRCSGP